MISYKRLFFLSILVLSSAALFIFLKPTHLADAACTKPGIPTISGPTGNYPAGPRKFGWTKPAGATKYALRIDDLSNGWTSVQSCLPPYNPGDLCSDNLGTNSYTYTLKAGHSYRWWVHAGNSCGFSNPSKVVSVRTPGAATPTPTPPPSGGASSLTFTIGLHGIGTAGDTVNPTATGNKDPKKKIRTVNFSIFTPTNTSAFSGPANIAYNSTSGKFNGTLNLPNTFKTGTYNVYIKGTPYLRAQFAGSHKITAGQKSALSSYLALVSGDINSDNSLNILDYNILIDCSIYGKGTGVCTSKADNKANSDLDDNGVVDQFDYNLLLREFSVQKGVELPS